MLLSLAIRLLALHKVITTISRAVKFASQLQLGIKFH